MKTRKTTVTVAISAYNEEHNIEAFLQSVIAQRQLGFILEHIWVYSDGSADHTSSIVKKLSGMYPIIQLIESPSRVGKSSHLNAIYRRLQSDILVQSDADVVFAHPFVIRDIIRPIIEDPSVGMSGGHPQPIPGETFIEKAINATVEIFSDFRKTVRGGNNVFSVDGRLLAYRRELVSTIAVPSDMIANDAYTYFCCLTAGYRYRFVPSARVWFRSPQTLADHIRQNTRFRSAPIRMAKYFPRSVVTREYEIPLRIMLGSFAKQFVKHPILCGTIFIVNRYCELKAATSERTLTARWDMAWSSKNLKIATSV